MPRKMFLCFFSNLFIKDLFESRKKQFFFLKLNNNKKQLISKEFLNLDAKELEKVSIKLFLFDLIFIPK